MAQPPITRTTGHSRWLPGFVLIALVVAFVARTRVETGQLTTTDLEVFWVSGKAVLAGRDPYLFWLPGAHLSLVYPPFTGLVLAPLAALACGLVIALANRLSSGLPATFILLSGGILLQALLNIPLTTNLLSNGAAILFLLWYLTPRAMFEPKAGSWTAN